MSFIDSVGEALASRSRQPEVKRTMYSGSLLPDRLAGKPLQRDDDWSLSHATERGFKLSSLVHRVVSSIATSAASVKWYAMDGGEVLEDHPLTRLLAVPQLSRQRGQYRAKSGQELIERFVMHIALGGNGIIQKVLLPTRQMFPGALLPSVGELIVRSPDGFKAVPSKQGLQGWVFEPEGGRPKPFKVEEILHVMLCNPTNPYWGLSPLKAASRDVDTHTLAVDWNRSSFENRTVGSVVFTYTGEAPLTDDEYEALRQQIKEQHTEKPYAPWVSGGDFKVQDLSRTPVEMDFVEGLKLTREHVLSAFGMPPVVAGFFENATLANAAQSRLLFWEDYLIPQWLERLKSAFHAQLVPHFGDPDKLTVGYSLSGVPALVPAMVERGKAFALFTRQGVPYNEAKRHLGLPFADIEGGDMPFGHLALQPATQNGNGLPAEKSHRVIDVTPKLSLPPSQKIQASASSQVLQDAIARAEGAILELARPLLAPLDIEDRRAALAAIEAGDADRLMAVLGASSALAKLSGMLPIMESAARAAAVAESAEIVRQTGRDFEADAIPVRALVAQHVDEVVAGMERSSRTGVEFLLEGNDAWELPGESILSLLAVSALLSSVQVLTMRKFLTTMLGAVGPERAVGQAARLGSALLGERGELLAGNEASWSVHHAGQEKAWEQARNLGVVGDAEQTWFDASDSDVCPICVSLDGQSVALGELFFSPVSAASYVAPPAHGRCRCGRLIVAI
jgi:phage portal protein BeeE